MFFPNPAASSFDQILRMVSQMYLIYKMYTLRTLLIFSFLICSKATGKASTYKIPKVGLISSIFNIQFSKCIRQSYYAFNRYLLSILSIPPSFLFFWRQFVYYCLYFNKISRNLRKIKSGFLRFF